jgi:hypothetical protein
MTSVEAWSYSRWATYETCPLQFKLRHIDRVPEPQAPAMVRGNKIHKELAAHLNGADEIGPAPLPPEALKFTKLIEELKNHQDKVVEQQWGFTSVWKPTTWFGSNVWFRSVLDVLVAYADETAEDVDWKSGKRYGSNDEQMETQAIAVFSKYPHIGHVTTRLVYLDIGEEEFAEFSSTDKEKLQEKWEKKVKPMFVDDMFVARPNDKCKFCNYSKSKQGLCRFG